MCIRDSTSAGMAIMGEYYFTAQNGTVTSSEALSNPYNGSVNVDNLPFLEVDYLSNVITDQHYDDPERKGRHVVFISRILTDYGAPAFGIACDEYTAVCIDQNGNARAFGEFPNYDDNAYFLQVNCEISNNYTNNNFRLEAEVFDIVGKLVMKEDFITKLDVSFLEKGTYILNLTDGINTTSHKIIKE